MTVAPPVFQMQTTQVFEKILAAYKSGVPFIIQQGGTRSSKTVSTLQFLRLLLDKYNLHCSVVSESMPHLKRGALKDFKEYALGEQYDEKMHNMTDQQYQCGKGMIEFFGADNPAKVHGPSRDILYVNECNNISYETFYQLNQRTSKLVILDYNPVRSFWVNEEFMPSLNDNEYKFIKSTYRDNRMLPEKIRRDIERRAAIDENYRRVYADGEIGSLEGLVFKSFNLVDSMPTDGKRAIGIDFGFTNDPTVIMDVRLYNEQSYYDECCYRTEMVSRDIINALKEMNLPRSQEIICDSASPMIIQELYNAGFNAKPCIKGAGSITSGLDLMKQYPMNVTKRSVNFIKELRNYQHKVDKEGKSLNEPIDFFNHCIDSGRYGFVSLIQTKQHRGSRIIN